jgi:hypothetical protein
MVNVTWGLFSVDRGDLMNHRVLALAKAIAGTHNLLING